MIYALPIDSDSPQAAISTRFARTPFFAIINKAAGEYKIIANPFFETKKKTGQNVMQLMESQNISALIAFELGLIVQQMANKKRMQLIILNQKNKKLNEILELLKIQES